MRFRVAPYLAPLWPRRMTNLQVAPRPRPLAVPAMDFRVAPNFASFRAAERMKLRVAPFPHTLMPRLWCRLRVSPRPASPASPAMDFRVAPNLASFGGADRPTHRVAPGFQPFGIADDPLSELPRIMDLPVPADGSPSCLGSRTIRLCLQRISGLPRISSSGYVD